MKTKSNMTVSKQQSEAVKENWICKLFGHKEFEIFTYSVGTKDNKIHKSLYCKRCKTKLSIQSKGKIK